MLSEGESHQKTKKQKVDELLKDVIGGYELNAQWRAAYALCVVEARSREDDFKKLRLDPPEVTCLKSTDAFYPRGNGRTNSLLFGRRYEFPDEKLKWDQQKKMLKEKSSGVQPSALPVKDEPGGFALRQ